MERSRQPDRHTVPPHTIPLGTVSSGYTQTITMTTSSGVVSTVNQETPWLRSAIEQGRRLYERHAVSCVDSGSQLRYDVGNMVVAGRDWQSNESERQQRYPEYQLFPVTGTSQGGTASTGALVGGCFFPDLWSRVQSCPTLAESAASNRRLFSEAKPSGGREATRVHVPYPSAVSVRTDEKMTQYSAVALSGQEMLSQIQPAKPIYTVAKERENVRLSSAAAGLLLPLRQLWDQTEIALTPLSGVATLSGAVAVEALEYRFFREDALPEKTVSTSLKAAQRVTTVITTISDNLGLQPVTSLIQASRSSSSSLVLFCSNADAQSASNEARAIISHISTQT